MARAVKGAFKCARCTRSFSMAAHLARHMSTIHSRGKKKAKKLGRPKMSAKAGRKRMGRPPAIASRLRLRELSFEELKQIVETARDEAQRRFREFEQAFT